MTHHQSRSLARPIAVLIAATAACFPTAVPGASVLGVCRPIITSNEYDIRTARFSHEGKVDVEQAERVHFNYMESAFRSGEARRKPQVIWSELEYMVRRYPNHIGALSLLDRLSLMLNVEQLPGSLNSVDCHFQRALHFAPDDMGVKTVYAIYLLKRNRTQEAVDMFKQIESRQPDNANNHYNLGLAYLAAKQPEEARQQAIKAYARGFSLPGLKEKLRSAGKWGAAEEEAVKLAREAPASAPEQPVGDVPASASDATGGQK